MHLQQPAKKIRRIDDFFKPSERSNSQLSQQSSASSESNTGALPKTAAENVSSSTNEKQKSSPWDITAILSESEVSERLERHVLKEFPKSAGRSFHSEWYRRFIWLECSDSVLERNRTYIRAVAEVIQFVAVNELPFRG